MKKALIAIIAAIYVFAIIIVSFLGIRAEVYNRTIDVEEIVLLNDSITKDNGEYAIRVYKRPDESLIGEDGKAKGMPVTWNYGSEFDLKRDYAIFVYDTNYLYKEMGKTYELYTSVKPEDATKKDLDYVLSGGDKVLETLSINNVGAISFSVNYTSVVDVDIFIKATDSSNVQIDVFMRINKYKTN